MRARGIWSGVFRNYLALILLAFSLWASADIELSNGQILSDSPTWIVSYIEIDADATEQVQQLIRQQVASARASAGNLYFEAAQRLSRDYHFVIIEAWANPEARANHAAAAHTRTFRQALQPFLYSPYDERIHVALEAADPRNFPAADASTIYAITHADLTPPEQFAPCPRRPNPQGPCGNDLITGIAVASRSHAGNLRFDVLTQNNRSNHMTLVEMWRDSESQLAHQLHPQKKDFRDALVGIEEGSGVQPDPDFAYSRLIGSLWDERLYRSLILE